MERMFTVQNRLENALLILAEDADANEKRARISVECLSLITQDDLPHLLSRDYYHLLDLVDAPERFPELPTALLLLYKRLTEWIAIEHYLRCQQQVLS
jgi:hypothetical protein